jgi:hypothetical protein
MDFGCTGFFDLNSFIHDTKIQKQEKPFAEKIANYLNISNLDDNMEKYRKEQMPG